MGWTVVGVWAAGKTPQPTRGQRGKARSPRFSPQPTPPRPVGSEPSFLRTHGVFGVSFSGVCWQTVLGFWCFRVSPAVVQASFSHPKKHATWRRWVSTAHLYARRCGRLLLSVLAAKHAEPAAYDISARHCLRQYPVFSLHITGKQARCSLFAYLTQTMHDALLHIF